MRLAPLSRALLAAGILLSPLAAGAAAVTDGSVGAVQSLSGRFTVPQSLGTVRGGNLFHSFARFGVAPGESASFTTTDAALRNVIARVTGGEASVIQGPLSLLAEGGARPSFWLVNPSGIVVGAGASFDVPAGLHLSTAQQLRFADGFTWDTRGGESSLTVAAPERFGFLAPAAALRWHDAAPLVIAADSMLELAAGEISVLGSELYAGRMRLQATGDVRLGAGAQLWSVALPGRSDSALAIDAAALTIDGAGVYAFAGSQATRGSDLSLRVSGALTLLAGAEVEAGNFSPAAGGRVDVDAGSLTIDGGGLLTQLGSQTYASGSAGAVTVNVHGSVRLLAGGQIHSTGRAAPGATGDITLTAASLFADGTGVPAYYTGLYGQAGAGGTGALRATIAGATELHNAVIWTVSGGAGPAAPVEVRSRTLRAEGRDTVVGSLTESGGRGAAVDVRADERISLAGGASLSTFSFADGDAGPLHVQAPRIDVAGIASTTSGITSGGVEFTTANAGAITVEAGRIELTTGGQINATTLSDGNAGDVTIRADSLLADGGGTLATGVSAMAFGRRGNAGTVRVVVRDTLDLRDGGVMMVANLGEGSPGLIDVQAGSVVIDGKLAPKTYTGIGGDAVVYQERGGLAAGGTVQVQARQVTVRNGGMISSSTLAAAPAGSVRVTADTITLDGGDRSQVTGIATDTFAGGAAGNVTLQANTIEVVNDAWVSSNTFAAGRGGSVTIDTRRLHLGNAGAVFSVTGVVEDAPSRLTGDAGDIVVRVAEAFTIDGGGGIFANTGASGAAGRISVNAGSLSITGADAVAGTPSQIASRARQTSDGQPGSITLDVAGALTMRDGAALTIENQAQVADPARLRPSAITVTAGSIDLGGGSTVLAASRANADAGRITLTSAGSLELAGSTISTTSLDGDGGPIGVAAGGLVRLADSRITTSVEGQRNGNGGDITLAAGTLLMQSGFVQANTSAPLARGGRVAVDVGLLVPDGSNLFVGGNRITAFRTGAPGFNVIQAAAPDGVAGTLDVTLPQLNLSGSLVGLTIPRIDFGPLGRDLCEVGDESSFTVLGRGATRPPVSGPLRVRP